MTVYLSANQLNVSQVNCTININCIVRDYGYIAIGIVYTASDGPVTPFRIQTAQFGFSVCTCDGIKFPKMEI